MAVSAFQKVMNQLLQQFVKVNGRNPQTPKEYMDLQNKAVQFFNKTKGDPKKLTPQSMINERYRAANPFIGFKPKVIEGGKGSKKDLKKTVEDFRDEGDWDPSGFAGGGVVKKFIERLFMKASNDIRQGKGKWKGLTQDQWIKQHDDLTKMLKKWEMGGSKRLPEGAEQFLGMNDLQIARAVKQADPLVSDDVLAKAYDEVFYQKPSSGDYKYDADVLADSIAEQLGKGSLDDFSQVQQTEIYNIALKRVTDDMKMKRTLKDVEQKMQLSDFDPKDRLPNQSGGLAYMLGEPTYMRAGGGSVGHGPWTTGQVQPQQPQPQQAPMHHAQGQPNPMKMPQGIPSAAPRSMDPRVMQQQMMQRAMMGQQRPKMQEGGPTPEEFLNDKHYNQLRRLMDEYEQYKKNYDREKQRRSGIEEAADGGRIGLMYGGDPGFAFEYGGSWADWHDQHRNAMPVEDYIQTKMPKERLPFRAAEGGRIGFALGGFDKARRAFLKMLAGLTAGGIAAGTGILKLGKTAKVAPKVIKEAEVIARTADGTPKYIYDLIEVVKAKGVKKIMDSNVNKLPDTVHSYKGVDVIEETGGTTRIKKQHEGGGTYTTGEGNVDSFDGITHEIEMEISPQFREQFDPDSGLSWYTDSKGRKVYETKIPDEYTEFTARPDMDGKLKDVDEGIDDLDHLELKEIADELHEEGFYYPLDAGEKLKGKASGGLAHLLGE